jgi:hypothetical protein
MEKLRQGPMLHLGVKGLDNDDEFIGPKYTFDKKKKAWRFYHIQVDLGEWN